MPGHEPDKIRKALASSADVVIIDWEDAVPLEQKPEARTRTQEVLVQTQTACRVTIRVNGPRSPWLADDLSLLKDLPVSAIIAPKIEQPAEVHALATARVPIIPLIESGLGVEQAFAIASAHPLVERLTLGPLDFLADLQAHWTPEGQALFYARSRLLVAGRAAGLCKALKYLNGDLNLLSLL
ncbi:MAG TPA: aldolase/citrate lyase family protein [Ktedonobacteraceae bacterium]